MKPIYLVLYGLTMGALMATCVLVLYYRGGEIVSTRNFIEYDNIKCQKVSIKNFIIPNNDKPNVTMRGFKGDCEMCDGGNCKSVWIEQKE